MPVDASTMILDLPVIENPWAQRSSAEKSIEAYLNETETPKTMEGLGIRSEAEQENRSSTMSTWGGSGLSEHDVNMQDVSNAVQEAAGEDEDEDDISEEAAVGRLSSMSLMAAVTASGKSKRDVLTLLLNLNINASLQEP